jgi:hypothetical protein
MSVEQPAPWERQPGEPDYWYARFTRFREMPANERTLLGAYRKERLEREQRRQDANPSEFRSRSAPNAWNRAALTWDWYERCRAWDEYVVDQARQAEISTAQARAADLASKRDALRGDEVEIAEQLLQRARRMLEYPLTRQRLVTSTDANGNAIATTIVEPVKWNMGDVARLILTSDKLRRLALDMETETIRVDLESEARKMARREGWNEDEAATTIREIARDLGMLG